MYPVPIPVAAVLMPYVDSDLVPIPGLTRGHMLSRSGPRGRSTWQPFGPFSQQHTHTHATWSHYVLTGAWLLSLPYPVHDLVTLT